MTLKRDNNVRVIIKVNRILWGLKITEKVFRQKKEVQL